jgi:argininosuccinate lyase
VMQNTPFTDMNDSEGEVQQLGYAAFERGARVLQLLTALIPACRVNADRVRRTTDAACITITELADTLVRDEGLTFRAAHEIAAATAKAVIAEGAALGDGFAAFAAAFEALTGRAPGLDEITFRTAVAPETFVARRDRIGGPAEAALHTALAGYAAEAEAARAACAMRKNRHETVEQRLKSAFDALLVKD